MRQIGFLFFSSIIILFISIYSLFLINKKYENELNYFLNYKKIALVYSSLNKKINLDKELNRFKFKKEKKNGILVIKYSSNDIRKIDKFLNKVLNLDLDLKYLKVTKNSVELGIKWKF